MPGCKAKEQREKEAKEKAERYEKEKKDRESKESKDEKEKEKEKPKKGVFMLQSLKQREEKEREAQRQKEEKDREKDEWSPSTKLPTQELTDDCNICFSEELGQAPCLQLSCGMPTVL